MEFDIRLLEISVPIITALIAAVSTHFLSQRRIREAKKFDIKKHSIFDHFAFYDSFGIRSMETGKEGLRDYYMKKYASVILNTFRSRLQKLVEEMDAGTEVYLPNILFEMASLIKVEVLRQKIPPIFYSKIFAKESVHWKVVSDEVLSTQSRDAIDYYSKVLLFFNAVSILYGNTMTGLELICTTLNGELDKEIELMTKEKAPVEQMQDDKFLVEKPN